MVVLTMASPSARADLINGLCKLDLTFTFSSPPSLTGTSPYTIAIDKFSAWSGCTLDTLESPPFVEGGGSASAAQSLASCGVLAGTGSWEQGFGTSDQSPPAVTNGSHNVAGTWLHATMVVSGTPGNPLTRFTGVIELIPHPEQPLANAYKLDTCRSGGNVTSLRMLGVQVFNDPLL